MNLFADNLNSIRQRIDAAGGRAGAHDGFRHAAGGVQDAIRRRRFAGRRIAGSCSFGKTRFKRRRQRFRCVRSKCRWHFIGHLQSNKVRDAVELFEMIQGVDSLALAQEISKRAGKRRNDAHSAGGERGGRGEQVRLPPEQLLAELKELNALPKIEIHGLMAIPPFTPRCGKGASVFPASAGVEIECEKILGAPLPHLSMGMSGDFEVAIEEGATMVRIGTALFGPRVRAKPRGEEI